MTDESMKLLWAAYAAAQANIDGARKDASNPAFKSKYATLASVSEACLAAFNQQGLSIIQIPTATESSGLWRVAVQTVIAHKGGAVYQPEPLVVPVGKPDAQGVGSAITYARRYALAALTGVCPEDDDGNAAVKRDRFGDLRDFMRKHELSDRNVCEFAEVERVEDIAQPDLLVAAIAERVTTLSSSVTKGIAASDRCMVPPRIISAYVEQVREAPSAWDGMQVWRGIGDQAVQVLVWARLDSRERSALKAAKDPGLSSGYRAAYERISAAATEDELNTALDEILEHAGLSPSELADITVYAQSRDFPGA